ncbi:MAG: hypothetical protein AAB519_02210 [Patescibacteria group bacterium]
MKLFPVFEKTDSLLVLFGLSFVVFGWLALSLALGSLFLFPLIAIAMAASFSISVLLAWKLLSRSSLDTRIVFAVSLLVALLISFFITPSVFSGRDQGSIAEAAYRLAENGELAFSTLASQSFFEIYGPGTALNFPGFAYTKEGYLITQFPLAYTAWLGSFLSVFGILGYVIANSLLLFLFLFFFYTLLRQYTDWRLSSMGFTLALFSFLPIWFTKFTLTENLAVFLFVFLALSLSIFLREGKFLHYSAIIFSGALLAFTRIEGFVLFLVAFGILLFSKKTWSLFKTYPLKSLLLPGLVLLFVFLRDFFLNLPYYKMIGKAAFKFVHGFGSDVVSQTSGVGFFGSHISLGSIFLLYGLLPLFILGLFGILLCLKEKRFFLLLPVLLALPTLIYLFSPNITLDHPWMLRRYYFSIFPALLFSAIICLGFLTDTTKEFPLKAPNGKRFLLALVLWLGVLFFQLPAFTSGILYSENKTLLKQTENFTNAFQDTDLVLVDRFATGNGFAMLTGPGNFLFHKNTVYFFNPEDLAKIDQSRFSGIYLLVPEENIDRYSKVFGDRMIFRQNVVFSTNQYENLSLGNNTPFRLPEKQILETRNILFQLY